MASEKGDLTKCSICLETLTVPKHLPCLHTYCEGCIESYINTSISQEGKGESIRCPVCRTTVNAPVENCSAKEWVELLPVNHLVVGLLEKGKIQRAEKQCMSCERLDKISQATCVCVECSDALCGSCQQFHKANRYTSNHKIVPVDKLPEVEKSLNFFRNECAEHLEEVRLYCVDHEVPCCSLCVSVDHRKCNEVITISQAAKGFLNSGLSKELTESLTNIQDDGNTILKYNTECCEKLDTQYDIAVKGIEAYFEELKNKVDVLKEKKKEEITKVLYTNKEQAKTNTVILENLGKKTANEQEILNTCSQKATEVQAMIENKRIRGRQAEHLKAVSKAVDNSFDCQLVFEPGLSTDEIIRTLTDKCRIEFSRSSCNLDLKTVSCLKYQYKQTVNSGYSIIDCFCDKTGNLVTLQDYDYGNNNAVTIYDINGSTVNAWTPSTVYNFECMDASQIATAEVNDDEMAVMHGYSGQIDYLNHSGDELYKWSINATNIKGLVFGPDKETAAAAFPDRVEIVKKNWTPVTSFKATNPKHLNIDANSRLLYTEENVIQCKNLDGNDCFTISNPKITDIGGMTIDEKGHIFVSSPSKNTVSMISPNGSFMKDILGVQDGLSQPSLIRISKNCDVFFVVNQNNLVLIFHRIRDLKFL